MRSNRITCTTKFEHQSQLAAELILIRAVANHITPD